MKKRLPEISDRIMKKVFLTLTVVFLLLFLFTLGFFCIDHFRYERSPLIESDYGTLDHFEMKLKNSSFSVTLPCTLKTDPGDTFVLETVLPDVISDDTWIDYYSGKNSRILIDGVVRTVFDRNHNTVIGGAVKGVHMFVELTPEDAGKVLRIERQSDGKGSSYFRPIYYGHSLGIVERILFSEGMYFVFALTLLIVSVIAIMIGLLLKFYKKIHSPITAIGIGVLLASLWLVFDSELFAFAFRNYHIDGTMSFLVMPLIPCPFLYYLDILQKGRYRKKLIFLAAVSELSAVVFFALHFIGISDFLTMLPAMAGAVGFVIVGAVLTLFLDLIRGKYKEYRISFIGLSGLILASITELVLILNVEERHDGSLIIIGLYWTLVLGIIHQLYEVREAQQETQMAIRASETKSNFLANMSHEIRTPMNAILGMDEMILREAKGNEKVMKYASDIKSAGNILLAIINDILDLSKIESGKAELIDSDFEISSVIHDLINITRQKAYDKGLKYHVDILETIPSRYYGDEIRVRQIILNVINNAIKYTKEGEVRIRFRLNRGESDDKGTLVVTVKDTGIGIREEDMPRLFDSFGRLDQTKNRKIEGTGLGLNIANSYLKMMGGSIDVQSIYGKGSEFTIHIPLTIIDNRPIGDFAQAIHRIGSRKNEYTPVIKAPNARILVVDDNEMNLEVICGLLESTSMRVDTALSGTVALEQMQKRRYDLIFLDQMMPEMDGVSTLQQMQANFDMRGVSVIALTADAVAGAREFYLDKGFSDYVSKPIRAEELEKVLVRHLPKQLIISEAIRETTVADPGNESENKASWEDAFGPLRDAGLNVSIGLEYTGGSDRYLSALRRYYRSSEDNLKKITEALEKKDTENLAIRIHALKSNSRMIGHTPLAELLELIEQAAKAKDIDVIEDTIEGALTMYRELIETLKPYGEDTAILTADELSAAEALEISEKLLHALDDFDDTKSGELAKKLSGYPFRITQKNKLREATDYIGEYMYDEAADLIREIMGSIEEV